MSYENKLKLKLDSNFDPIYFWINYSQKFNNFYVKKRGYSFTKTCESLDNDIEKYFIKINFFEPLLNEYATLNDLLKKVNIKLSDYLLETKSEFNKFKSDINNKLTFSGNINEYKEWVNINGECYFSEEEDGICYFNYLWTTKINLGWFLDTTGYIGDFLKRVIDKKITEEYNEYPKICMDYYINEKKND